MRAHTDTGRFVKNIRELTLDEFLARFGTSENGLSSEEAANRLLTLGPNALTVIHLRQKVLTFLRISLNPLVVILLFATGTSFFLGENTDAAIIGTMVLLSAGLNLWQTSRSERAMKKLERMTTPVATVRRDGTWADLPRQGLVEGDVIRLVAGDLVPADARLLMATDLHVEQAALTGESLPTEKAASKGPLSRFGPDCAELVFLGTSIVSGSATAVVFATGKRTGFGDVVERLAARPEETEFERGTRQFGMLILKAISFLVLFILAANLGAGRDPIQSLMFSIALAIGLTPEFLPMITSVTLAQGAVQMARQKVIIKHLPAIQNLGSINILCSDKTGTLTSGAMALDTPADPLGERSDRPLQLAFLNSAFQTGIRSPLDAAILAHYAGEASAWVKTDEIPFDFERRRVSVVLQTVGAFMLITKGAPENVIGVCSTYERDGQVAPLDSVTAKNCQDVYLALSRKGLRVLGVAYGKVARPTGFKAEDEKSLTLAGFVTFADPILAGVGASIIRLNQDGIQIKILTGDNELVARHVCEQAGIDGGRIVLGEEIVSLDDFALARVAAEANIFARVTPAQKHRIVHVLKSSGNVVGFMGDGINDAPSLHGADVGISVSGAVDVAREASDIILLERNLDVLHAGIIAGRRSFGNVIKYLLMGTSSNFGNMISMAGASLFLPFLPMMPMQILLNNFLYDLAQVTIPTDKVDPEYLRLPHRWNVAMVRNFMLILGPISSIFDFLTFFVLLKVLGFDERLFQTGWFLESLATQTLIIFVIRTMSRPWRNRPSFPLMITTLAVVLAGAILPYSYLAAALGFEPLPAVFFLFLAFVLVSYFSLVEIVKNRIMGRFVRQENVSPPFVS